jgi:hypothetical protein
MEAIGQFHTPALFTVEEGARGSPHWVGGWVGPSARLVAVSVREDRHTKLILKSRRVSCSEVHASNFACICVGVFKQTSIKRSSDVIPTAEVCLHFRPYRVPMFTYIINIIIIILICVLTRQCSA